MSVLNRVSSKVQPRLAFILVSLLTSVHVFSSLSAAENQNVPVVTKKRVLVINAYHEGYHWADRLMSGVHSVFSERDDVELYIEYMDSKRCSEEAYYELLEKLYRYKYQNTQIDVIVACDDNALDFLLDYQQSVFPDTPVSFCGIVDYQTERIAGHENYTGVYESYDAKGTVELIRKNHPNAEQILVIADHSTSAEALLAHIRRAEPDYAHDLHFEYLINLPQKELLKRLAQTADDTPIIWAIHLKFPNLPAMTVSDSLNWIKQTIDSPIYCIWDVVGLGVVGGKISRPEYQGAEAARKALEILDGTSVSDIPVTGSPMAYKLDYVQLKKHNLSVPDITGAIILVNDPYRIWHEYRGLINTTICFIIILIIMTIVLSQLLKRSKRAEHLLNITNEELRISMQKAEESERLKSAFIRNLSHEIRTPLNGIIGFVDLFREEDLPREERLEFLEAMKESSDRMVILINDLLSISIIESESHDSQTHTFPLNNLTERVIENTKPEADRKQIELRNENGLPDFKDSITTDETKLETILLKLLSNAVKFTSVGHVSLRYFIQQSFLVFEVEDTGIGIDPEKIEIIFKAFRRLDDDLTSKAEGIGLGLSISQAFVSHIGGEMTVESEINKGSIFRFTIPYTPEKKG